MCYYSLSHSWHKKKLLHWKHTQLLHYNTTTKSMAMTIVLYVVVLWCSNSCQLINISSTLDLPFIVDSVTIKFSTLATIVYQCYTLVVVQKSTHNTTLRSHHASRAAAFTVTQTGKFHTTRAANVHLLAPQQFDSLVPTFITDCSNNRCTRKDIEIGL